MADFAALKAQVSIIQVLDMLAVVGLSAAGDTLRGPCPICKEGNSRAFVVTPARNIFFCFSEKKGGSIIDLVARFRRIPEADAGRQIAQHFGIEGGGKPPGNAAAAPEEALPRKPTGFDPQEYMKTLDPAHAALKDLGIPEQTIRDFDGGYCAKGLNRGRLTLPVHSPAGELLGFMGLSLKGEQPETQFPKGFEPPSFFNIHRVGKGMLYLVSTPTDVLRAWDNSLQDVICPLVPVTPDVLASLADTMRTRGCDELTFY